MWQRFTLEAGENVARHISPVICTLNASAASDAPEYRMEAIDATSLKPSLDLILALWCDHQCIPSRDTSNAQWSINSRCIHP